VEPLLYGLSIPAATSAHASAEWCIVQLAQLFGAALLRARIEAESRADVDRYDRLVLTIPK
jgi:hypothetical protein